MARPRLDSHLRPDIRLKLGLPPRVDGTDVQRPHGLLRPGDVDVEEDNVDRTSHLCQLAV